MLENKDEIKIVKSLQNSSNPEAKIKNNNSFTKDIKITKYSYSNHIVDGTNGEDSRSKNSILYKRKSKKKMQKKNDSFKNKKKNKEKISKLLKNDRLKFQKEKE